MGDKTFSGRKTIAFKATKGSVVDTGALDANAWYEINAIASSGSTLPTGLPVTGVFKTPDTSAIAITLGSGDEVIPLTLERICKTDAEINCEEGTIEVTDDCEEGFTAMILDGYKSISGTLNGFLKYDEVTQSIATGVADILGRFFNVVTDDGEGTYSVTSASNEAFILFTCLNKDAAVGQIQNWIILPVLLSSLATGAALKDAQKRDLSWVKAQGYASLYKRTVFSADILS
jgi:hypothetical protein